MSIDAYIDMISKTNSILVKIIQQVYPDYMKEENERR